VTGEAVLRALWRFGRGGLGAGLAALGSSAMIDGVGAAELLASAILGHAGR
jgi:hypothetical protein